MKNQIERAEPSRGADAEREAFETWARWSGLAFHLAWEQERGYVDADTWKAFKTWQASAAAALERAAQLATECEDEHFGGAQVEVNNRCGQVIAAKIRVLKGRE